MVTMRGSKVQNHISCRSSRGREENNDRDSGGSL